MSDILQSVQEFGLREQPPDPRQQEYRALKVERARIDARIKELQVELTHGLCAMCGASFQRLRASKIFCSQKCAMRHSAKNRRDRTIDRDLIAKHIDAIDRVGLLSERSLKIARDLVADPTLTYREAGERHALSYQRMQQILGRAMKAAQLIELIRKGGAS